MSKFKKGDRVLVTLSGIEVPATVEVSWEDHVAVVWEGKAAINVFDLNDILVRLDPAYAPVEVGTVLHSRADLLKIKTKIVLLDRVNVAGVWYGTEQSIIWAVEGNVETSSHASSVCFPATVLWVEA